MFETINRIQLSFLDMMMKIVSPFVELIVKSQPDEENERLKAQRESLAKEISHRQSTTIPLYKRKNNFSFNDSLIFKSFNETISSLHMELKKHGK